MGLRKDAAKAAAARLRARDDEAARLIDEEAQFVARMFAALEQWSERTGIPVRKMKPPVKY